MVVGSVGGYVAGEGDYVGDVGRFEEVVGDLIGCVGGETLVLTMYCWRKT